MMENPRQYRRLEIVTSMTRLKKLTRKIEFYGLSHIGNGTMLVKMDPVKIIFQRPLQVGLID